MKKSVTQTIIDAYARFFEKHRLIVLVAVLLATLVSIYGTTRLTFHDDIAKLFLTEDAADSSELDDIRTRTDRAVLIMLEAEDLDAREVRPTSVAYLTFVSLDDDGRPTPVPRLILETDEERAEHDAAEKRREARLKLRKQTLPRQG